jgi:hypothetical protein
VLVIDAAGDALRSGVPGGTLARALRAHLGIPEAGLEARRAALRARAAASVPEPDRQRVTEFLGQLMGVPLPTDDSPALRAAHADPQLIADQQRRELEDWLAAECAAHAARHR